MGNPELSMRLWSVPCRFAMSRVAVVDEERPLYMLHALAPSLGVAIATFT